MLDFGPTCVQEEAFKDRNRKNWVANHLLMSVSISSNIVNEPIFLCNSDPHHLIASVLAPLECQAWESKAHMKLLFFDIETTMKIKLGSILVKLNQHHTLIKSCSLLIIVNERDIEPTVIKKSNQLISFKFDDIQFSDIMTFLGGATSYGSFSKAYETSETEGFFPYGWFGHPDKTQKTEIPTYDVFTVNCVAVTVLKPNTRSILTY